MTDKLLDQYLELRLLLDRDIGQFPFCIETTYSNHFLAYDGQGSILAIAT
ncbi:MAG TPA: hypothetical protein VEP90_19170 [Methylomirabilota bacterium]|nr:hypothetical protein [Methylomirabilota bacterium]